jgi:hypothetical protein
MKAILEKLKLVDYLTTELPIDKKDFIDKLKMHVDQGDIGIFFSAFEVFSSSKNEYKGTVTSDSFKIRRRRKFFDMTMSPAIAEGSFRQRENRLIIESTIKGFHGIFIPFIALLLIFYIAFILSFIFSDNPGAMGLFMIPFIFIHAAFMLGIPYFIMRRSVSRMKYELERDFYYLTK